MTRLSLNTTKRDASGKSPTARRLRKTGQIPGVMYHSDGNVSFAADALELASVLRKGANLIDLKLEGDSYLTVLKDYQVHPVRGSLVHIDLQSVRMDQKIRTTVTLNLVGESPGQKEGAILTQGISELLIECLASEIPDAIEFDVSEVHAGETRLLSDVAAPNGVTFLDDEGSMVVALAVPRGAKGATDEDGVEIPEGEEGAEGAEGAGDEAASGDDA